MPALCRLLRVLPVALGVVVAAAAPALAHWADLAVAEITVGDRSVQMTLTFPTGLAAPADANRDDRLSPEEIRTNGPQLAALMRQRIRITSGGRPGSVDVRPVAMQVTRRSANITPESHSTLMVTYVWPQAIQELAITYDLFVPGVSTASCLTTILWNGRVHHVVFTPEHHTLALTAGSGALLARAASFLVLGIEHILTGYDHVLFLLSLLALGGSLRALIKIVSAFTVAHSITLSLAVLNLVMLPSRWVESAIALSIVYVALENFWRGERALRSRWLVTFGFGLVHGLGFASVLQEIALPRGGLALSLAGFNLGVEVGQVAIIAVAYTILRWLRTWPREVFLRRAVSAGAAAAGLVWFVQRAILP